MASTKIFNPIREYPHSKNRLLILDWGSLSYHQLWALKSAMNSKYGKDIQTAQDEVREWKAGMIRKILDAIRLFNPLDVIIALEGTKTWRHDVYTEYYTKHMKITYSKDGYFVMYDNDVSWVRKENGVIVSDKLKKKDNVPDKKIEFDKLSDEAKEAVLAALPKYKGARQKKAWDFNMSKHEFNMLRNSFAKDVSGIFRAHVVMVDSAEGDDVIAVSCEMYNKTYESMVLLTRDSDMNQLFTYPNFSIYNHMTNEMVECKNPTDYLNIKILSGDTSDSIPGIALPDKKKKLGEDGAITFYESLGGKDCFSVAKDGGWEEQYIRNRRLIDLSFIPENVKSQIREVLSSPQPDFCPFWDIQSMGLPEPTVAEISKIKSMGYYSVNPKNTVLNNPGLFNLSNPEIRKFKQENDAKVVERIGNSSSYSDIPNASEIL